MKNRNVLKLNFTKKAALTVAGMAALTLPIAVGIVNAPRMQAQGARLTFEEISIRPLARPGGGGKNGGSFANGFSPSCYGSPKIDPGRFAISNTTVYHLITYAFGKDCPYWEKLSESEALAGPRWIREDRFDVQAVIPPGTPAYTGAQLEKGEAPQLQIMIQSMLEDRFNLRLRRDMKEMPVYALTVARGGPKLTPPKAEVSRGRVGLLRMGDDGQPRPAGGYGGPGSIHALVSILGNFLERPVVDRTGITAEFDFELEFGRADECTSCPTAAAALQDKMGLSLSGTRAPVEVMVIDRIEKPSEN